MLTLDAEKTPTINGGPLSGPYAFMQLHFHWGENDDEGSEDLLDGQRYVLIPMSMQHSAECVCHPINRPHM